MQVWPAMMERLESTPQSHTRLADHYQRHPLSSIGAKLAKIHNWA